MRVGQLIRRPVAALLLLGQINAEEFFANILQPVSICVGPDEARSDFCAKDVVRVDAQIALHDGDVETAKMEDFRDVLIEQQGLEVGRVIGMTVHLHDMRVTVAGRQLHQAQLVADERQPLRFRINGDRAAKIQPIGQVVLMQMICHPRDLKTSGPNNNLKQQCPIFGGRPDRGVIEGFMLMLTDHDIYEAFLTRTDLPGAIIGVKTTGVFCRPGCPARMPKFENCEFYTGPEAALRAGYRACKRCHPAGEDHALMRAVIALVEQSEVGRIDEAALKAAGIDPSTARRKFTQRLGMSVAEYARLRRLGLAAKAMAGGASVIEAQLDAGFESASGFRTAFAKTFGAAPAKTKADPLFVDWVETPEGRMVVVADGRALYLIEFVDRVKLPRQFERLRRIHGRAIVPGTTDVTTQIRQEMAEYFAGTRQGFSVKIETTGTAFQGGVWDALMTIPYGQTWSYAELAVAIGNDKAVRAVASANGSNGLAIVIPCHRVIGSDGGLGGYAGGIERKARLLKLERASKGADL